MRKLGLLGSSALRSGAVFALAVAAASPAFAEDAIAQGDTAANQPNEGAIVVTGSRIRRPNLESTVPITSIGGEQIFQGGDPNVAETLNELPQLRSTFAQSNPGLGIGIGGLNLLDLRGLGTARTLVLVNGRRHVAADILVNAVSPDISSIPNDLIERVDVVTGGNSAIYGSDAIAGVVNFVLRRDFQGLQVRGQAGINEWGGGGNQYLSAMYGRNFGEGRGNITVHGEYARQDRIFASDIPEFRSQDGLAVVDLDTVGCAAGQTANCLPNGSDGFPDRNFFRDIRSGTIHYLGLIPINQRSDNTATPAFEGGLCGNATIANNGGTNTAGAPFSCNYIFTPDGRLVEQTGARFGTSINAQRIGGNGQTGREGNTVSVLPFLERFNFNLLAHYEFAPAFEAFIEAKWNRVNALGNNAGPSFIQTGNGNTGNVGDARERPRIDNPFLNPADRTALANLILNSGCNPSLQTTCPAAGNLTATDIANINNGSYRFILARNLLDVGLRDENFQRDTIRIVGGLRGTFNDDWSYEISANYGQFRERVITNGYIDRQRFSLAMDAGRDPLTGQIRCRSQFDAASAIPIQRAGSGDAATNQARLAADIAACIPYNPFGAADNRAAINYFSVTTIQRSGLEQFVLNGFMSGDTSDWFELWGGPIRFALGAEYRREDAFYNQDPFATNGFSNNVSIPPFAPPAFEVKEAFAEIQIPILRDRPFFHELTLSGAARVASYQGGTGTVWSYNAGLDWAPIRDLRFRGAYSRAVRAPNVSETAFPLVPNFAPGFNDPCQPNQINNNPNRAANCLTDLGAALLATFGNVSPSLGIVSGSNPNLVAETSDSWTVGAVFQPRFLPGFSLSVDYYNITVNGIITSLTAQQIVNTCYDLPDLNNIFCQQFQRNRTGTTNATGDLPGRLVTNSLVSAPLNFARREREGIDFNLNYRANLGAVQFQTSVIYTHNLAISNYQDSVRPTFENRILSELGDPEDEFRWDVDLTYGPFTLGYRMRFIGPMYVNTYENFNGINAGLVGETPAGGDDADYSSIVKYPAVTYHDLRFEWNVARGNASGLGRDVRFYVGVDNLLDQMPPLGSTATGAGSAIYEFRGRNYYAGFRARF